MTLEKLIGDVADQWPLWLVIIVVIFFSLPQLAERFALVRKLAAPLLRRWEAKNARMEEQRRKAALEQVRADIRIVLEELTPPDVVAMNDRMSRLEDAEDLLRAYVIYDELWHFHDDHNEARHGRRPAKRLPFDMFEAKWKQGWRPFDDHGQLVDDGTN